MNRFRCNDCNNKLSDNDLVITVDSNGEWVLHCNICNSTQLELTNELISQSLHGLKTYYELEED